MKTAMQILFEDWKEMISRNETVSDWEIFSKPYLEKEKEQIIDAAIYGNGRANVEDKKSFGEIYYSQTYNSQP